VVADKTASSTPSCSASKQKAHQSIAVEAFSNACKRNKEKFPLIFSEKQNMLT
jgi:hypothetical protein